MSDPTPDKFAQDRAAFLRDLVSDLPPCCAAAATDEEEDDPYMTAAQRDILRAQVLAMSFADTRLAVAQGATAILTSVYGTELADALTRAVRGVLGSVGDLFDGDVGHLLTKVIMDAVLRPEAPQAPSPTTRVMARIEVNGEVVGFIALDPPVTAESVAAAIRGDALAMSHVHGEVVDIDVSLPGVVRITTKPHEQPPAAPAETT